MSPSADAAAWKRLGELLTRRRVEIDPRYSNRTIFSAERGLDYRLAYDIEEARRANFRTTTLAGIANAYAVTLDSLFAVLRNGADRLEPLPAAQPRPAPVSPAAGSDETERRYREARVAILNLTNGDGNPLPAETYAELIGILDEVRRETRGDQEQGHSRRAGLTRHGREKEHERAS